MNKKNNLEQTELWTEAWKNSLYSIEELADEDKWISVKNSPILPYILKYIPRGSKVLEAGCGLGQWVIFLSRAGFDIIGVDYSIKTVEKLNYLYPQIKIEFGDVLRLNFPSDYFDAILSWGVVEHFKSGPQNALKEKYRILKNNSYLFITVPVKSYLYKFLKPINDLKDLFRKSTIIRKLFGKGMYQEIFFQYEFGKKEFNRYLGEAGFKILELIPLSHEYGFAKEINKAFSFRKEKRLFHKNKIGKWDNLNFLGSFFCKILYKISVWFTPDFIFFIVIKREK